MTVQPLSSRRYAGKRAYLYGRVSTVLQNTDGYSLIDQETAGEARALAEGMRIIGRDYEQGSGADWDLDGIEDALRLAKAGAYDVLVMKNTSRLARDPGKFYYVEHKLKSAGAEMLFYDEPFDDSTIGKLVRGVMVEIAAYQLRQSRDDSIKGRKAKVTLRGQPVGNGPTAYGWRRIRNESGLRKSTIGYEPEPAEKAIIERFRTLHDISVQELCDILNAEGVPSPGVGRFRASEKRPCSGRWQPRAVWGILKNPMTWGEYRYGERQVIRKKGKQRVVPKADADVQTLRFPPILTEAECEAIRASLVARRHAGRHPSRHGAAGWGALFPMRGMLVCGHCGGRLSQGWVGDVAYRGRPEYRAYRCLRHLGTYAARWGHERCPLPNVAATARPGGRSGGGIEELIWGAVERSFLDLPAFRRELERAVEADDGPERHRERVAFQQGLVEQKKRALAAATAKLTDAEGRGDVLDVETYGADRERIKRETATLLEGLARLEAAEPLGLTRDDAAALVTVAEAMAAMGTATAEERREILRALRVEATVWVDPEGPYVLGRHRYRVACAAMVDLGRYLEGAAGPDDGGSSGRNIRSFRLLAPPNTPPIFAVA